MTNLKARLAAGVLLALAGFGMTPSAAAETGSTGFEPLVRLAAERLAVADRVAAVKFDSGKPVEVPAREREVLAEISEQAERTGVAPTAAAEIFRDQIEANKLVQRGLIFGWKNGVAEPPEQRPDMDAVRARIDEINDELLSTLARSEDARHAPDCRVELARAGAHVASELDTLHGRALVRSLRSVCR
ncbi:chorismate mutase [Actinopolyspora lacussalsi]|nr:chorismate mutase [Actinopolyspora lacussalsi]